jgi:hypothetical protein
MSQGDIERYRKQAQECREQAERAVNPLDRSDDCALLASG